MDYHTYISSSIWKAKRQERLDFDTHRCAVCHHDGRGLADAEPRAGLGGDRDGHHRGAARVRATGSGAQVRRERRANGTW